MLLATCSLFSLKRQHTLTPFISLACTIFRPDNDYGLVWKVEGYDDRFPGDLSLFSRIGVYGTLKRNKIHDMFIGACEFVGHGSSHSRFGMSWVSSQLGVFIRVSCPNRLVSRPFSIHRRISV